jgi:hypothetical protein
MATDLAKPQPARKWFDVRFGIYCLSPSANVRERREQDVWDGVNAKGTDAVTVPEIYRE